MKNFCNRAVAYIKPALVNSGPTIDLPFENSPVFTDLGNGLMVTYIVDEGDVFKYIQHRHLTSAGLTVEELHKSAVKNLANIARINGLKINPYGSIFPLILGGNFEASLILVDELWDEWVGHLTPSGAIVALPCRDVLAFCDASSDAGIEELRRLVIRVQGGDHPISPILYRRHESTWQRYAD
jgi:uncharacterized protein YtpQ (UPF0354 family)